VIRSTIISSRWTGARDPGRRAADQLGLARVRAAARLGPHGTVPAIVEIVLTDRLLKE